MQSIATSCERNRSLVIRRAGLVLAASVLLFLGMAGYARAASLSFTPGSGTYTVGHHFSVGVVASSTDQPMNAVSVGVSYPTDTLELVSISRSGSIIDFWVQEPSFNNGAASFEGVMLNGYTGAGGRIATLRFRVRRPGNATVRFTSGEILANDGLGTSILSSGLGPATFALVEAPEVPPVEEEPEPAPVEPLGPPVISSPTHPDPEQWYSNKNPIFTWPLPEGVTGVNIQTSRDATPDFDNSFDGRIDRYALTDLDEGTHYLHVIFQTGNAVSQPATFKFNVDTQRPEGLRIEEVYRSYREGTQAEFLITVEDDLSGVAKYRISIGGQVIEDWVDDGSHRYITPPVGYGKHVLVVEAIDRAGNIAKRPYVFAVEYPLLGVVAALLLIVLLLMLFMMFWVRRRCRGWYQADRTFGIIQRHLRTVRKHPQLNADEVTLLKRIERDLSALEKKTTGREKHHRSKRHKRE